MIKIAMIWGARGGIGHALLKRLSEMQRGRLWPLPETPSDT